MALINTTTTGILGSTFSADGTGPLNIQQNGVTLGVYGNIIAFSASLPSSCSSHSITSTVATKVPLSTENFDTNSNFDNSTNYRFLPTVAGYYQINGAVYGNTNTGNLSYNVAHIYKNGSVYRSQYEYIATGSITTVISALIYFNGTTDYVELYVQASGTSPYLNGVNNGVYMDGYLVKAV
jgi:hypothetical protein